MTDRLRILLAQLNPTVGDVEGNLVKARAALRRGLELSADLVVLSELFLCGYPPEDLVLKPSFVDAIHGAIGTLAQETRPNGPALLIGAPWRENGLLHNAALLLEGGAIVAKRYKRELPNYGVFDEKRVFAPGPLAGPVAFRGARLGLLVCEDMWTPEVAECLGETAAQILIVVNGSPYEVDKTDARLNLALARVVETGLPLVYVNQVGGQDELVFDGASFVVNADRTIAAQCRAWREEFALTAWTRQGEAWVCAPERPATPLPKLAAVYSAMTLGLRDYVNKNRFPGVVLGMSGGIDSALSAVVAVDALGPERVRCLLMPSPYTSRDSVEDATAAAGALGIRLDTVSIEPGMRALDDILAAPFAGRAPDIAEENIQARLRGMALMAISNKFGPMVLTTGNKSEMSVGYATLYGDMCGGYSVLKDVYKTTVYQLGRWRNEHTLEGALGPAQRVIPERIFTKAPTAELKPNQTDQDTLPPYDVLDDILECLVEREMAVEAIVGRGHDAQTVARVARMLYRAEYKRRQAPPGVKITAKSFGRDRRYPITNAYTGDK
jgi:NAD+ synthase